MNWSTSIVPFSVREECRYFHLSRPRRNHQPDAPNEEGGACTFLHAFYMKVGRNWGVMSSSTEEADIQFLVGRLRDFYQSANSYILRRVLDCGDFGTCHTRFSRELGLR